MTMLYAPLTIKDVLHLLPGVSERALRDTIRKLGCYSSIGGKMYLELEDFETLLKGTKACHLKSSGAKSTRTSAGLLTANAYEKALALATQKSQKLAKQKKKHVSSGQRSTESSTKPLSLKLVSNT